MGDLSFYSIIAGSIGWGLGGAIFWRYQHWKATRAEIKLVSDGRGGFHDSLIRKERVFWTVYVLAIVLGLVVVVSLLNGYI